MTNNQIILQNRFLLMEEGVLKPTGQKVIVQDEEGKKELDMPEEIHTYQGWKERGYQVNKGEKAIAKFTIWKHVTKKKKDSDEETEKMFMKNSSWFKMSQCTAIEE